MISPGLFVLLHLAIVVAVLLWVAATERRDRRSWTRWHRGVRTRHLTTEELLRRLAQGGSSRPNSRQDLDSL